MSGSSRSNITLHCNENDNLSPLTAATPSTDDSYFSLPEYADPSIIISDDSKNDAREISKSLFTAGITIFDPAIGNDTESDDEIVTDNNKKPFFQRIFCCCSKR